MEENGCLLEEFGKITHTPTVFELWGCVENSGLAVEVSVLLTAKTDMKPLGKGKRKGMKGFEREVEVT